MTEMFKPLFECVERCEFGEQAVKRYEEPRPEIVLMNIRLPGIDGLDATERIVRRHPSAKIYVVTAYEERRYREHARKSGACGFFLKDDLSELYDTPARQNTRA